jgi:4-amino-4-deoxychorismate lyase
MSAQGALRDGIASGLGLIETLRWEPAGGFLRLDRHMARLEGSAGALGLPFPRTKIDRSLATVGGDRPLRVRLVLGAGGAVGLTTHPFAPLDGDMVWMLAIASTRLSSADPLLRHKTTRREAYARARAEFPATTVEEVLLLNERGEVCEGTITTLFVEPARHRAGRRKRAGAPRPAGGARPLRRQFAARPHPGAAGCGDLTSRPAVAARAGLSHCAGRKARQADNGLLSPAHPL